MSSYGRALLPQEPSLVFWLPFQFPTFDGSDRGCSAPASPSARGKVGVPAREEGEALRLQPANTFLCEGAAASSE